MRWREMRERTQRPSTVGVIAVRIYEAANVGEAVELATAFRDDGRYDWFRGQRQNWSLKSSLVRLAPPEREHSLEQVGRYEQWVKGTPGLGLLATNTDAAIAVAQHYGLPTNFVDFTTEPRIAGFFASEKPPTSDDEHHCILCLDTTDLQRFWLSVPREYPPPELLRLEVPNLWRLEAQHGVFLFCPYGNFENMYDLDRILFPHVGRLVTPTSDDVYPARKSHLEILLDQYFMKETLLEGTRNANAQIARGLWTPISFGREDGYDRELVAIVPPDLDSWTPANLQPWLQSKTEVYGKVRTAVEVDIAVGDDPAWAPRSRERIAAAVVSHLNGRPDLRKTLVKWSVRAAGPGSTNVFAQAIGAKLARLWDGMRSLPYSDDEVATGMATCIAIDAAASQKPVATTPDSWLEATNVCLGQLIYVEFGADDGSYSRAHASTAALLSAVRKDIAEYLAPAYLDRLRGNMTGLLQAVQNPRKLFDFRPLARVFAEELIPSQVLTRGTHAVFFSPARLSAFGLS
jgi:hypothetical protein